MNKVEQSEQRWRTCGNKPWDPGMRERGEKWKGRMKTRQWHTSQPTLSFAESWPCWHKYRAFFFFSFFFLSKKCFSEEWKKKKILNSPELADRAAEIRSTCDSYPTYESIWKSTCHPFFARVNTYQARRSLLERRRMMCLPSWLTIAHQLLWGQEDCSQTTGVRESPIWEGDTEFSVASACQLMGSPGMRIYHSL